MPLFVPVAAKLSLNDTFRAMSHHFEGTWFDNTGASRPDVGAGPGHTPYRFRPLTWQVRTRAVFSVPFVGCSQRNCTHMMRPLVHTPATRAAVNPLRPPPP